MINNRSIFFLISLIFISTISFVNVGAQKFKILTKSVHVVNNELVVDYDFTKFKQKQRFIVWLEIKNSAGNKLNVKTVSGDVGEDVEAGENKQIRWNFLADKIVIDDNIEIEVKAELMDELVPVGKALMLSAVLPGWGLSKIKKKKSYLFLGAVTYSTVFLSYVYNENAYSDYYQYLDGDEISSESEYYSSSKSKKAMSNVFKYTAITSWAVNMIWTYIAASKSKSSKIDFSQNQKMRFNAGINHYTKTPIFMLSYRF